MDFMEEGHREVVLFVSHCIKRHRVWGLHLVLDYFSEVVCLTHASLSLRSLQFLAYNKVAFALGPLFPTPHATKCPSRC